jgi:hypothetical protein
MRPDANVAFYCSVMTYDGNVGCHKAVRSLSFCVLPRAALDRFVQSVSQIHKSNEWTASSILPSAGALPDLLLESRTLDISEESGLCVAALLMARKEND